MESEKRADVSYGSLVRKQPLQQWRGCFCISFTYINIYKTILTIKSKHLIDKCGKIRYHIVAGRDTLYTREIELTFKRHVMSAEHEDAAHREMERHFFCEYFGESLDEHIYLL